jgi:tRNA threonylcarbamoyladenosine biosynthesis protein TsaE
MTDSHTCTLDAENERRTAAIAAAIAGLAGPGDVIALAGDLGAGKSVFARAFIYALGGSGDVPSPTFTLVQMYELAPANVFHFDLYRLEKPEDAFELDMDDAFHEGISLIEWPARLGAYLPPRRLLISIDFGASQGARMLHLDAPGAWAARIEGLEARV